MLWDLDNTLIDRDRAALAVLCENVPCPLARRELQSLDLHGHGCRSTFFQAWERLTGQKMDQRQWSLALCRHLTPETDLLDYLRALSLRVKTALVSNGGQATQRAKLQAAGLDQVFPRNTVFISAEVGWSKPDPRLFHTACQSLGVKPEECLMVGDSLPIDGFGALQAGLGFLWVARR